MDFYTTLGEIPYDIFDHTFIKACISLWDPYTRVYALLWEGCAGYRLPLMLEVLYFMTLWLVYVIVWFAVQFGINCTHNVTNSTRLRLVQFLTLWVQLIALQTILLHNYTNHNYSDYFRHTLLCIAKIKHCYRPIRCWLHYLITIWLSW